MLLTAIPPLPIAKSVARLGIPEVPCGDAACGASCTKQMLDKLFRLHYGQKGQISRFDQMIGDEQNDAIAEIMMGGVL